jgi:hypothetical protein
MKLQELAVANPAKQTAKVFESYFGKNISVDHLNRSQARTLLQGVTRLIREHRRTPEFHRSEHNPAYLKLVMMEQVLSARLKEQDTMAAPAGATPTAQPGVQPQATQAAMALQQQQRKRQIQDQIRVKQQELQDLQKQLSMPMSETRRLREASEIQQAQVVLASQDMVDQVQKMSEQVSAMQFKDLPALVDQIKNEVGADQAMQFNGDASAALSGLLQNLQGAKQQLEVATGVVTGQAPQVPGADMGADTGAEELPAELPADGEEEEIDIDAEMDANIEPGASTLGRARR